MQKILGLRLTGRSDGGGCGAGSGREPTIHRRQQPRRRARHCAPTHHQPSESSKLSGARSFLSCAKVWRAVLRTGHEGGGGVGPPQLVLLQLLRVLPPKHPPLRAMHGFVATNSRRSRASRRRGNGGSPDQEHPCRRRMRGVREGQARLPRQLLQPPARTTTHHSQS